MGATDVTERMTADQFKAELAKSIGSGKHAAGRHAQGVYINGIYLPRKGEAKRWGELLWLQQAGEISELERQVDIVLMGANGPLLTPTGKPMVYKADFVYTEDAGRVIEDVKGFPSPVYTMKKAILAAQGVTIKEVKKAG